MQFGEQPLKFGGHFLVVSFCLVTWSYLRNFGRDTRVVLKLIINIHNEYKSNYLQLLDRKLK